MPSLQALEEFKTSFADIGNELKTLAELALPLDDYALPEHEPAAIEPELASEPGGSADSSEPNPADQYSLDDSFSDDSSDSGSSDTDVINFGDLGDLLGGMDNQIPGISEEGEDFPDFSAEDTGDTDPNLNSEDSPPAEESASMTDANQADADFGSFIDTIPDDLNLDEVSPEGEDASLSDVPLDDDNPDSAEASAGDLNDDLNLDDLNFDELSAEENAEPGDAEPAADEFDLDDLSLEGEDAAQSDGEQGESEAAESFPPGLLDGLADEIEAERASPEEDKGEESEFGDFPDFDTEETMHLLEEDPTAPVAGDDSAGVSDVMGTDELGIDEQDLGLGDEGLGDLPEFDSDETLGFEETPSDLPSELPGEEEPPVPAAEEDIGDFDLSDELPVPEDEEIAETDEDNFDLGGEEPEFDNGAVLEEISTDSFDNFKLDGDALSADFDLGVDQSGGFGDDFGGTDDFSLPGLDLDLDSGSSKKGAASSRARSGDNLAADVADEIEEISLTEDELEQFQKTLSSYPLNLRIACEELIAEQLVDPEMLSQLVKLLVNGASAREAADLAGKILNRTIPLPRGSEKKTGEALEAEQTSFAYIFVHNFLPVLRLFAMIALVLLSAVYLSWRFIYTPLRAEKIYKLGIERITAGEYGRANERFREAFGIHEKKSWFYTYARAFKEARQYTLAEEKYQELLYYTASKNKQRIPEKAAVMEFADMETNTIGNYQKAEDLLWRNILDYYPWDRDALLALGDNSLAWGEYEPKRLEDARESFAKIMERYGRTDPLLERMLLYFIRTDDLGEVLTLQSYFMASAQRKISASTLAEMGGYLLDKKFEKIRGVPNEYLDRINGIREILLRAIQQNSMLPESYYQLARYYYNFENFADEKLTLELAIRVFEHVKEENPKRIKYHIFALRRYAEILVARKEFFPAEENLVKAVDLYQDGFSRRLLSRSPEFGKLYAELGDLEYFVKDGNMQNALDYYRLSEQNGWAPPEIQYRMGAAYYQLRQWGPALDRFFAAYRDAPPNRRILYALGNVSYMRGNNFAAQGYYDRLLEILEADRSRLPPIMPTDNERELDLAERLMVAENNFGVILDALTERTGNNKYRSRAQGLYSDSERAWDILTRNPKTMVRMRPSPEINAPGVNPAYLNVQNSLHPVPGYQHQFFLRIDKDMLEPSKWEELAPPGYRLSQGIFTER